MYNTTFQIVSDPRKNIINYDASTSKNFNENRKYTFHIFFTIIQSKFDYFIIVNDKNTNQCAENDVNLSGGGNILKSDCNDCE